MSNDPFARQGLNVGILAGSQAFYNMTAITVMTLSGLVGLHLSPDPALATLPVSFMMLGTLFATLPASLFMQRVGRRTGFLVGATLGGLGGLLSVWSIGIESFWMFCVSSMLFGFYQAFAMYYRFAAADVARPQWRSKAISLVLAGGVVAAFLGPINASRATDLLPGLPNAGPYAVVAVLAALAVLLLVNLRVPPIREPDSDDPRRPLAVIAAQPAFVVALICGALGYGIMVLVMTATPLAMRGAGFSMNEAAFVMQWHVLGMFAPSFVTGHLIARYGVFNILTAGAVLLGAAGFIAASGQTLPHFWSALLLLGIGWNFLFVGGSHLLTLTHTPAERGKTQGVNDLTIFAVVAAGSLLSGVLIHKVGWATLNLTMMPFVLVVLFAVLWLRRRAT
ncbi:MFS transporter [Thioalkalivibrio denitrificans]|uniref:MFS transporter n=1 Tax=Thioalkalivibrio denitrificans TaxID=108003 RepID=A0A1V3NRP5_9GAMM|nr:MFS transporter [Thioalkalivibrio denitrificans]OOG27721.1 MFS transporter [Thioalkalivibrio denitrificans]